MAGFGNTAIHTEHAKHMMHSVQRVYAYTRFMIVRMCMCPRIYTSNRICAMHLVCLLACCQVSA